MGRIQSMSSAMVLLLAAGCGSPGGGPASWTTETGEWGPPREAAQEAQPPGPLVYEGAVVRVVDGDTVSVDLGGWEEPVRLIGIDTPETGAGGHAAPECGGEDATAFAEALLPEAEPVIVEVGAEARDLYGRLLGYVARSGDGLFVNLEIASAGHAEALAIEPNTKWADEIGAAVDRARNEGLGLWGHCAAAAAG